MRTHTLRGIISRVTEIQNQLGLIEIRKASRSPSAFKDLQTKTLGQITTLVKGIEGRLSARDLTGADLAIRSRRAFQWLKFLTDPDTLLLHLDALQRFNLYLRTTVKEPANNFVFSLYHQGSLYKVRHQPDNVKLTAQESFLIAPDQIIQSLVRIALDPSSKDARTKLREYTFSKEYQQIRERLEYLGIPTGSFAAGTAHDLEKSFHRVNQAYFKGKMAQPHLVWNQLQTRRKFGHYQWDTDTVMISRSLDTIRVPEMVLDYVVYHELLHKKLGARKANQNRIAHTYKFREAEDQFVQIEKAKRILTRIAKKRARTP